MKTILLLRKSRFKAHAGHMPHANQRPSAFSTFLLPCKASSNTALLAICAKNKPHAKHLNAIDLPLRSELSRVQLAAAPEVDRAVFAEVGVWNGGQVYALVELLGDWVQELCMRECICACVRACVCVPTSSICTNHILD